MHPTCDEARTCAQGSGRLGTCRDIGKSTMKFMLTFSLKPETKARDEAIGRFKATGARSPKGAKLLGRSSVAASLATSYDFGRQRAFSMSVAVQPRFWS